ncbi:MAG: hypothetical protein P1V81_18210 [Planctomycetota bacterium]|nr:hypothetical protein [Planctomycetota bacterium]
MDALNGLANGLFNLLLWPFEGLGALVTLTVVSIVFMPLSMLFFKRFSSQKGIAAAKGKIKGHMIEIRIYQDDLMVVMKAVCKVMYYNLKYLFLNFAPFVPLSIPFVIVVAQLVVRFGFAPIPVEENELADLRPGQGVMIEVVFDEDSKAKALDLEIVLPEGGGLAFLSPIVANAADGVAFREFVVVKPGAYDVEFRVGGETETKRVVTGTEPERLMQPIRTSSFWDQWLWPVEPSFSAASGLASIEIAYPDRQLTWMMDGAGGVFIMFVIVAFIIGGAAIKIFDIQI